MVYDYDIFFNKVNILYDVIIFNIFNKLGFFVCYVWLFFLKMKFRNVI